MITWDDPTSTQKDFHDHTQNSYAYFLLSDEDMLTDHKPRTEVYPCTANKRKITIYAPSQTLVSQFVNSYNKPDNCQIDGNSWYDFGGTYVKSYIQIRNMECESN